MGEKLGASGVIDHSSMIYHSEVRNISATEYDIGTDTKQMAPMLMAMQTKYYAIITLPLIIDIV